MMYFHTDDPRMLGWLSNVLIQAAENERRVRIDVDSKGQLKIKVGEGVWTSSFASTPDPYRDLLGR